MSEKFTVTLQYTRHLQFEVEADSAREAYAEAREQVEYGDNNTVEDWADGLQLEEMKLGDREIEFAFEFDWKAPKDARGLTPLKTVAKDAKTYQRIDADLDTGALLDRLFSSESTEDGAS
ncbi:hypothetical protein [Amycolatopsis echigonensis]|uniref:Uncharacterized protein n=1 Tax=Amycolatopsis echigonensis TaxID=2576905 RepID=A0A8E1W7N7_9PSEU|nr:hypothetical protein [Amycolatopsis echigonensis]MBB2506003.1 hypothetical protein [Amycolatopsis echigonensis]